MASSGKAGVAGPTIARARATRIRRRIIISLLPCGGGAGSVAGIAIALSHQARIIGGQVRGSQRRQVRLSHLRALAQNFFSEIAQLLDPLGQDASLANAGVGSIGRARSRCAALRSEEHTSELQSLMRISYAVFCL